MLELLDTSAKLTLRLFPNLHWKQQREILLDIGDELSNKFSANFQKDYVKDPKFKFEITMVESNPWKDILMIEEYIEKYSGQKTDHF
ncbi:hypothetical protein M3689_11295 [Alkalihalophilus marmarensis]|jgi:hypothetical protein|uniref:hypothetical protein n=1 Tax=Alkalihalophilus marmarensis TaxID=521377 RepID=UPI00203EFF31|nr:hypothetical protein [Alkalihalophilus marmarensis]MCM3489892.1 hypothetical protein [Alkalihalophilus marmarensis]